MANQLVIAEPSTANAGSTVFYTGNTFAAESFDAGKTFSYLPGPYFGTLAQYGGLCCDQSVMYDPTHDLFFWILQYYQDPTGHNAQRLAVAKSTAISTGNWMVFDLRPENFGYAVDSHYWLDYPQLSLTSNNLNVLSNVFKGDGTTDESIGSIVIRLPLSDLANGSRQNQAWYIEPYLARKVFTLAGAAGSQGTLYFAGNEYPIGTVVADTTVLHVFDWPEGTLTVTRHAVAHSQFEFATKHSQNCAGPDGGNWCGIADSRVVAGWLSHGVLGFMWNAGAGGTFTYPYVYSARIDATAMTLIDQPALFNPAYAFLYPNVAVNGRGDLGLTVQYGGGAFYPSSAVGIVDDLTPVGTGWELVTTRAGAAGPADPRWGDFLAARPASGNGNTWIATGFTLQGGRTAASIETRFIWFGRQRDNPFPPTSSSSATASGNDQYHLSGSDGSTWREVDPKLRLTLAPQADSRAIISANADLWTAKPGVNQDLGIAVFGGSYLTTGTIVAWKESGGFAGTFSPNAAFVQTVSQLPATGGPYTVGLYWKANRQTDGTIYAGAGNGPEYSPTRLTAELVANTDTTLDTRAISTQEVLPGNDGATWQDLGNGSLTLHITPSVNGTVLLSGNADLWTQNRGINQDLGIRISGGGFGTAGRIDGWKESGGFAGTFSPNAAFVQTVEVLDAATAYAIRLQWKTNKATSGVIRAGAGDGPDYSPTRLTMRFFAGGTGLQDASTNYQYVKSGSTGYDWTATDGANLQLTVAPASDATYRLSANADLWTARAGVNQDMGLVISGGEFGAGQLVAWKESGGFAGTYSPNAAFVETVVNFTAGNSYLIVFVWKANAATNGTIFAAAGISYPYSSTRLTAQLLP